jgi:hypothetical protein
MPISAGSFNFIKTYPNDNPRRNIKAKLVNILLFFYFINKLKSFLHTPKKEGLMGNARRNDK